MGSEGDQTRHGMMDPQPFGVEPPFSLAPSIFLPFKGFPPGDAPVLEPKEKLQKIIQNLGEQQGVVRGNMMFMVQQRIETLRANARAELAALEDDYEDDSGDPEERQRVRLEVDAMFTRAKIPAKENAKNEDFEVKPGFFKPSNGNGTANLAPTDRDVMMGGLDSNPKPRTARKVWESLSKDLQLVVDRAATEIEAYDRHAQAVINHYRQALERRTGRSVSATSIPGTGGGILRNRTEESPVDMNAIRRMSTGMPIVGLQTVQTTRTYEKFDDIARRGSK